VGEEGGEACSGSSYGLEKNNPCVHGMSEKKGGGERTTRGKKKIKVAIPDVEKALGKGAGGERTLLLIRLLKRGGGARTLLRRKKEALRKKEKTKEREKR